MDGQRTTAQTVVSVDLKDSGSGAETSERTGDRDLIYWTLSLSVEERLAVLQDFVETFWTPQHG
jgi:hypothetical protein